MTDNDLQAACEKVAKFWLKWEKANGLWFPPQHQDWPPNGCVWELASSWGMGLLLDAVEERGYEWMISYGSDQGYECMLIDRNGDEAAWIRYQHDKYAALIYALDKAATAMGGE